MQDENAKTDIPILRYLLKCYSEAQKEERKRVGNFLKPIISSYASTCFKYLNFLRKIIISPKLLMLLSDNAYSMPLSY